MSKNESTSKSKTAIWVAVITGIFTLFGTIITVIAAPIIQQWLSPTPTQAAASVTPDTSTAILTPPTNTPTLTPTSTTPTPLPPTDTPTPTPPTDTPMPVAGQVWVSPIDGAEMVHVPAGEFTMGSPQGEGDDNEHPQHTVYLNAFYIDKTEVTNAQYGKCVEAGACKEPGCRDDSDFNAPDQPVVCVDWYQAQAYCEWAEKRLPTEAEWEKAVRGTDERKYPWGNEWDETKLNSEEGGPGGTTPVGQYSLGGDSPYGAADMSGNVWEWVADWYDSGYYRQPPERSNPSGPDSGLYRVYRGGSWRDNRESARCARRAGIDPGFRGDNHGFRCARGSP